MGGSIPVDEDRAAGVQCELARARRIAEALTSAGDRAIVEAYIRELSAHPIVQTEGEAPAWQRP